ncbi:hypothetical protein M9Y10_007917 [Tritrichomonas musculus]|uniref:Uncharacterized protein n=1 Tax=Tritrichomonas musculus TaxID=1915356 RepID=A0ABR2J4F4_9EUKA
MRRFPKRSMKEKMNNKPPIFPEPSESISAFSIELIKNSFKMADGIDSELVLRRYKSLIRFHSLNNRNKFAPVKRPAKKPPIKKPI